MEKWKLFKCLLQRGVAVAEWELTPTLATTFMAEISPSEFLRPNKTVRFSLEQRAERKRAAKRFMVAAAKDPNSIRAKNNKWMKEFIKLYNAELVCNP